MQPPGWFVERAAADTIRTIRAVGCPEGQAGFRIDRPSVKALAVGYIIRLIGGLAVTDGLAGAFDGAFFALHAKIPDTEFNRSVRDQRQN